MHVVPQTSPFTSLGCVYVSQMGTVEPRLTATPYKYGHLDNTVTYFLSRRNTNTFYNKVAALIRPTAILYSPELKKSPR